MLCKNLLRSAHPDTSINSQASHKASPGIAVVNAALSLRSAHPDTSINSVVNATLSLRSAHPELVEGCITLFSKALLLFLFINIHITAHDLSTYEFLENQTDIVEQESLYEPSQNSNSSPLLCLCLCAHTLEKISYLATGYCIVTTGIELKQNIHDIETNYYWPFSSFAKFGSYTKSVYTITGMIIKLLLLRYATKSLIYLTCPKELCKNPSGPCPDTKQSE